MSENVMGYWYAPLLCLLGCTPTQLTQVQDASNKRETICRFVEVWVPGQPELKHLDELCKAGADLKEIAAAYAECPATEVPSGAHPTK